MATTKTYFHDHLVLFLLAINSFLAIFTATFVFLRLASDNGSSYIVQYRSSLGVSEYKTGGVSDIVSFGVFAILILIINVVLSTKTYTISRNLTIMILSLGILLTVIDLIVSNSLIVLH